MFSMPVYSVDFEFEIGTARGEWGNIEDTVSTYQETRIKGENVYLYQRGELNDHPIPGIRDEFYIGVSYFVTDNIVMGGYYKVGNTTQRIVDDLYGVYLKTTL